jgi:ring-1,2-phenylacetyl-CoA epoxidase subunit PaaC
MIDFTLHLADNALVLGHRNSEWTGHGPILEQDIALSNISLDLIGQARLFYQYAAGQAGNGSSEDSLAYLRSADEFKNCLLAEQPKGHWGTTILKQFLISAYSYPLYDIISRGRNETLAAIASKSLKEVTYHLRWSSEWVVRLGQGTEESHQKMQDATNELWQFVEDLVTPATYDPYIDQSPEIKDRWNERVLEVLRAASISLPTNFNNVTGGKEGRHTQHLHAMLEEMQALHRAHPGVEW